MNKARREALAKIGEAIEEAKGDIEMLRDEEQEYLDAIPESLQSSDKHDTAENAVSSMDDAINRLEEVVSSIEEAQN